MELLILVLLIVVILCMILMLYQMRSQAHQQEQSTYQMLMKQQETQTQREDQEKQMQYTFHHLMDQMQVLRKEQALSSQSMEQVTKHIESLNRVMVNTKARGNWGEYQLETLLALYAGENSRVYSTQYTLENGKIADAILHIPKENKVLCIDSKFPMENYIRLCESKDNTDMYVRAFKTNMKKHIDDIASKYITLQTVNQAILFIPSEAIYQYVCGTCEDILEYALKKHVLLVSPTTLVGVVFSLLSSTRDFYRAHHMEEIEKNIILLQEDVQRLVQRCDKAEKTLVNVADQFHQTSVSAHKISKRIEAMAQGKEEEE